MGGHLRVQDRAAGLQGRTQEGRFLAVYDPKMAFDIVERLAEGELLREICTPESGMPHQKTFRRWLVKQPDLLAAYNAAVKVSAVALEEEALAMGRKISREHRDGTHVRAYEVAMNQLRWSATRRDPQKFGDKANQQVVVPIQINTTLDLASSGLGAGTTEHPNIYELTAKTVIDTPFARVAKQITGDDNASEPTVSEREHGGVHEEGVEDGTRAVPSERPSEGEKGEEPVREDGEADAERGKGDGEVM